MELIRQQASEGKQNWSHSIDEQSLPHGQGPAGSSRLGRLTGAILQLRGCCIQSKPCRVMSKTSCCTLLPLWCSGRWWWQHTSNELDEPRPDGTMSPSHKLIQEYSLQGSEAADTLMQNQHLAKEAAKVFFSCHWSKITVAHTTILSCALDEGSFPLSAFLFISALDCIDAVYKLISNSFAYSFEALRHSSNEQTDASQPVIQEAQVCCFWYTPCNNIHVVL